MKPSVLNRRQFNRLAGAGAVSAMILQGKAIQAAAANSHIKMFKNLGAGHLGGRLTSGR